MTMVGHYSDRASDLCGGFPLRPCVTPIVATLYGGECIPVSDDWLRVRDAYPLAVSREMPRDWAVQVAGIPYVTGEYQVVRYACGDIVKFVSKARRVGAVRVVSRAGLEIVVETMTENGSVSHTIHDTFTGRSIEIVCVERMSEALVAAWDAAGGDRAREAALKAAFHRCVKGIDVDNDTFGWIGATNLLNTNWTGDQVSWKLSELLDAGIVLSEDSTWEDCVWRLKSLTWLLGFMLKMQPVRAVPIASIGADGTIDGLRRWIPEAQSDKALLPETWDGGFRPDPAYTRIQGEPVALLLKATLVAIPPDDVRAASRGLG